MKTRDNGGGVYQIAGTQAACHVIDDVMHHQPSTSVSGLIHYSSFSIRSLHQTSITTSSVNSGRQI